MATMQTIAPVPVDEIEAHAEAVDRDRRFPTEGLDALRRAGLLALGVPAAYGGPGGGPHEVAAAIRSIGGICGSTSMVYAMHLVAVQTLLADPGPDDGPKAEVLRAIATGEHLTTLAFSARGSRSHFWAQTAHAVRDGDEVVIDDLKTWVTSAAEADSYVVAIGSPGVESPLQTDLYLVDARSAGITVLQPFEGLGMCGNGSSPVSFSGVRVPASHRVGKAREGYRTMMAATLPWFVLACGACCVGLSGRALALAIEHAGGARLEHQGESLRDLPVIRARLAEAKIRHLQADALLGRVLDAVAAGTADVVEVLAVKAACAEMAIEVSDAAMRACGGAAYSRQLPVERLFRDARAASVMAPTTDVLRDLVGRALTGLPV